MKESALPRWPSGGNRRKLDERWLDELERHGLWSLLPETVDTPPELGRAVEEFNSRLFWECHETLENIWRSTSYPLRFFYHALIKVAVGFHHLSRHNRHGARAKLADGVRLLPFFLPRFMGVRIDLLHRDASTWLARVDSAGSVEWRKLDALPTPRICTLEKGTNDKRIGEG